MKVDPYKHKERYLSWKESVKNGILNLSEANSKVVLNYIFDMEHGLNISGKNKKGSRSYIRLNSLKQRMIFLSKKFYELYEDAGRLFIVAFDGNPEKLMSLEIYPSHPKLWEYRKRAIEEGFDLEGSGSLCDPWRS